MELSVAYGSGLLALKLNFSLIDLGGFTQIKIARSKIVLLWVYHFFLGHFGYQLDFVVEPHVVSDQDKLLLLVFDSLLWNEPHVLVK